MTWRYIFVVVALVVLLPDVSATIKKTLARVPSVTLGRSNSNNSAGSSGPLSTLSPEQRDQQLADMKYVYNFLRNDPCVEYGRLKSINGGGSSRRSFMNRGDQLSSSPSLTKKHEECQMAVDAYMRIDPSYWGACEKATGKGYCNSKDGEYQCCMVIGGSRACGFLEGTALRSLKTCSLAIVQTVNLMRGMASIRPQSSSSDEPGPSNRTPIGPSRLGQPLSPIAGSTISDMPTEHYLNAVQYDRPAIHERERPEKAAPKVRHGRTQSG